MTIEEESHILLKQINQLLYFYFGAIAWGKYKESTLINTPQKKTQKRETFENSC